MYASKFTSLQEEFNDLKNRKERIKAENLSTYYTTNENQSSLTDLTETDSSSAEKAVQLINSVLRSNSTPQPNTTSFRRKRGSNVKDIKERPKTAGTQRKQFKDLTESFVENFPASPGNDSAILGEDEGYESPLSNIDDYLNTIHDETDQCLSDNENNNDGDDDDDNTDTGGSVIQDKTKSSSFTSYNDDDEYIDEEQKHRKSNLSDKSDSSVSSTINLIQALENDDPTITWINLSQTTLKVNTFSSLAKAISLNHHLGSLSLYNCHLGNNGIFILCEALTTNKTVSKLNLANNKIADEGAIEISKYLSYNGILKSINLDNNMIGDTGASHIGKALLKNNALEVLNLGTNRIKSTGVATIAKALTVNNNLKLLSFFQNDVDVKALKYLLQMLSKNNSITSLSIGPNNMDEFEKDLCDLLSTQNNKILSIHTGNPKVQKIINSSLQKNHIQKSFKMAVTQGNHILVDSMLMKYKKNKDTSMEKSTIENSLKPNIVLSLLRDSDGDYPMHLASFNGHIDVVRVLLKHGASIYTTNKLGKTAIDVAKNRSIARRIIQMSKQLQRKSMASYYGADTSKPRRITSIFGNSTNNPQEQLELDKQMKQIEQYMCPITKKIVYDPVLLSSDDINDINMFSNKLFEREVLVKFMKENPKLNPIDNMPLRGKIKIKENRLLKKRVEIFLSGQPEGVMVFLNDKFVYIPVKQVDELVKALDEEDAHTLAKHLENNQRLSIALSMRYGHLTYDFVANALDIKKPITSETHSKQVSVEEDERRKVASIFHYICLLGNISLLEIVLNLFEQDTLSAVTPTYEFESSLFQYAAYQFGEVGALLIAQTYKWEQADFEEQLFYAISIDNRDLMCICIKLGASLSASGSISNGMKPLQFCVEVDKVECAKILIDHTSDEESKREFVNSKDSNGNTALHLAAKYDDRKFIDILIENGAKNKIENDQFLKPVDLCINEETKRYIIDKKRMVKLKHIFEPLSNKIYELEMENQNLKQQIQNMKTQQ